jgi:SAM-dependent methyltransferase
MTKEFYDGVYRPDHPSGYGGIADGMLQRTASMRDATRQWLADTGLDLRPDASILEIGCGMAHLAGLHSGWHGVEFSKTAVDLVKAREPALRIFEGDAQNLPFPSGTFDGLFTWATLEHVPNPDRALLEIHRVLKNGGEALIAPAWNCRSWTVKKLEVRRYRELRLGDCLEKALIPLRERVWARAVVAVPKRVLAEIRMLAGSPMPLRFRRLFPRWDLIDALGHVSDDDAVADIDPHAAICFFRTRQYRVRSHPTTLSRLLSRHEPVIVTKPGL